MAILASMPRVARIVIPDLPHHVTQRGNNRQDVFFTDDDYRVYLGILRRQSARYGLEVMGFCLMPNHIHLVAVPATHESLAKAVGRSHWLYAQYINKRHGRSGHLWQNRFFSCPLGERHAYAALAYVDRNPVRARLERRAWAYPWSSAAAHIGRGDTSGLLDPRVCRRLADAMDWESVLRRREDPETLTNVRGFTRRGRPLVSDTFLSKLERALGRRLRPLPVGRPRKKRNPPSKNR